MNEELKKQLMKSAEKMVETSFTEIIEIAKFYAGSTESEIDDKIVDGIELVKKAFLDSLIDKISDTDGD